MPEPTNTSNEIRHVATSYKPSKESPVYALTLEFDFSGMSREELIDLNTSSQGLVLSAKKLTTPAERSVGFAKIDPRKCLPRKRVVQVVAETPAEKMTSVIGLLEKGMFTAEQIQRLIAAAAKKGE